MPNLIVRLARTGRRSVRQEGWLGPIRLTLRKVRDLVGGLSPRRRALRERERAFDDARGIDTRGIIGLTRLDVDGDSAEHSYHYRPSAPEEFVEILKSLPIRHEDFVFLDLGSGKGRALLLAAELPFRRVIGVELSRRLHETALRNIAAGHGAARLCRDVVSIRADATAFELPDDPVVIYLYNPFDAHVLAHVLDNLRSSLARRPRPVYVVYATPFHAAVVDQAGFLTRLRASPDLAIWRGA